MNRCRHKFILLLTAIGLLAAPLLANAETLDGILANITSSLPGLYRLIAALSYVLGVFFMVRAVMRLNVYGKMTVFMASQAQFGPTVLYFLIGMGLLYFPTLIDITNVTIFNQPGTSILQYPTNTDAQWESFINPLIDVVRFVGYIAFLRGWILLSKIGGQGQPNTLGKALMHILGGLLAINIVGTINVVHQTLFASGI